MTCDGFRLQIISLVHLHAVDQNLMGARSNVQTRMCVRNQPLCTLEVSTLSIHDIMMNASDESIKTCRTCFIVHSPDHCGHLSWDLVGANCLVEIHKAQILELGEFLQRTLDVVDVGLVVLGVVNIHSGSIDVGLEAVIRVRERGQLGERHGDRTGKIKLVSRQNFSLWHGLCRASSIFSHETCVMPPRLFRNPRAVNALMMQQMLINGEQCPSQDVRTLHRT